MNFSDNPIDSLINITFHRFIRILTTRYRHVIMYRRVSTIVRATKFHMPHRIIRCRISEYGE